MRFLWVHGFASGPSSRKGRFARDRLHERGVELAIPDFNEPSFFDLTVSRMLTRIDGLAGEDEPAILFGSSLGGFAAATWAAMRPERARLSELDEGHELTADLPALWKRIERFLAAQALLPTP